MILQPIHEVNDCHAPGGNPTGGQFCSKKGGGSIWKMPLSQYAPYPEGDYTEARDQLYKDQRKRAQEWERAARAAIATGELSPEDANRLAGSNYRLKPQTERGIWEEVPRTLYHVTVNRDAVLQDGLKTKAERGVQSGEGLGGGDPEAISFTADKAYAGVIADAFRELHDVATGKTTLSDLFAKADAEGFGRQFDRLAKASQGDIVEYTKAGRDYTSVLAIPASKLPSGAVPVGPGWMGRDERIYNAYTLPMSEERKRDVAVQLFNAYLTARQEAGGPENPWFTFNDAKALARIPREQIAVLEATMKPGAKGYFQSTAEREWRVPTGRAVETIKVVKP